LLKDIYLKKVLLILSIILATTFHSEAQDRSSLTSTVQTPILRFYPNPATAAVTFDFQKGYDKGYTIQIYHILGRKMYESMNIQEATTINLSDYTRGVYVYKLFDKTGRLVESGKFQVSK
jgi:hypothetical protein